MKSKTKVRISTFTEEILRKSIDYKLDLGFTLDKKRSKRHKAKTIIDADYADDLALLKAKRI